MAKKKLDKETLLKLFLEKADTFSEEELLDLSEFFSRVYSKLFISSRDDAFDILLNQGLPKAIQKLSREKQIEIKQKFLAL